MRDNMEIKSSPTHVVKVEGERHSLLIKWTKPSDAGPYTVTATNEVGKAVCSATLFIKSGECFLLVQPARPITINVSLNGEEPILTPRGETTES